MQAADMRPMSTGELLDRAFTLYRRHLPLFVSLAAVPLALVCGSSILFLWHESTEPWIDAAVRWLAQMLLSFLAYGSMLGAMSLAVSDLWLRGESSVSTCYRGLLKRQRAFLNLLLTMTIRLGGLFILIGPFPAFMVAMLLETTDQTARLLISMVAAAIIFGASLAVMLVALRYGVAVPALLNETVTARGAIKRSVALTSGHRGRVFLIALLGVVISVVASVVFNSPFWAAEIYWKDVESTSRLLETFSILADGMAVALAWPISVIAQVLLYYDLRVRTEGLDIQFLLADLERARTVGA